MRVKREKERMRRRLSSLLYAYTFLTRLPFPRSWLVRLQSDKDEESRLEWQQSVAFYPVIGLVLGLVLWLWAEVVAGLFPLSLASVLLLVGWVYITGGLHLDGWMDLADGYGSNRSREEMLTIIKDSRVGAMGVLAAVLLLMVKAVVIYEWLRMGETIGFIVVPLVARFAVVIAMWRFPYVREQGMATSLRQGLNGRIIAVSLIFTVAVVLAVHNGIGTGIFLLTLLWGGGFVRAVMGKLGGMTGDTYGALVEWVEVGYLLIYIALFLWW